jgi:hypothetical protein
MLSNKMLTLFPQSYLQEDDNDWGLQFHPLIGVLYSMQHLRQMKKNDTLCLIQKTCTCDLIH